MDPSEMKTGLPVEPDLDMDLDENQDDDLDLLQLDAASTKVEDLTYGLVNIDAPTWYINPDFKILFRERSSYDSIAACSPLSLAPNLDTVLSSSDPPSVDFFLSLPRLPGENNWGVYGCLMKKPGCLPKLYIGSGTNQDFGVENRMSHYKPDGTSLPKFVYQAFRQGYRVANIGLLCWTPTPTAGLVPRVRARIMALEAAFTVAFHACIPAITDQWYHHLVLWNRDTVADLWAPLCSHTPLNELIRGDLRMSSDQLELIAAIRKKRMSENANKRSQKHRAAQRAKDLDAYRLKDRVQKNAWAENNRARNNEIASRVRTKAIEANRFRCDDCSMSLQTQAALTSHLLTQSHQDQVAGIEKSAITKSAVAVAAVRTQAKADKLHFCSTCEKAFANDWSLTRHNNGILHAKRVQRLQAASS